MTEIAIFASGNGSNFEAIIKYFSGSDIDFTLVSDRSDAYVFERAKRLNVKAFYVPFENTYAFLTQNQFDLIVLAGYMRILPEKVLKLGKFINIHPSLLPDFKGKDAIKRAFESKISQTGVSIHYVNSEVDSGEIIACEKIKIKTGMTFEELENEVHKTEHSLLPRTIKKLINKYNVLLVGSGAREHALAWKIKQSKFLNKLYLYGANDGFKNLGIVADVRDYYELARYCLLNDIDLVVIGPEKPLSEGIVDILNSYGIECIGSNKYWTQLESSKSYAKCFMEKYDIPTAKYVTVESETDYNKIPFDFPFVIKADGLAAGKGVEIVYNKEHAQSTIKQFLNGKYGEASKKIVVEEFLQGDEISLISLWDGKTLLPFPVAKDYKKLNSSADAPNTGGMGSICPVVIDERVINEYIKKLQSALLSEKADFKGVIYSGLINTAQGIKVLEFNMRFGDPETQAIMMNIDSDILELFLNTLSGNLNKSEILSKEKTVICLVLAADGYPDAPKTEDEITMPKVENVQIFYAGVKNINGKLHTASGRVLSVCSESKDIVTAAVEVINFKHKIYRKDIIC